MQLADAVEGSLRGGQVITVGAYDEQGKFIPIDVTGTTITGEMRDLDTNVARAMQSTFIPLGTSGEADQGDIQWDYAPEDLVHARYSLIFSVAYPTGPTPLKTFRAHWYVAPGVP